MPGSCVAACVSTVAAGTSVTVVSVMPCVEPLASAASSADVLPCGGSGNGSAHAGVSADAGAGNGCASTSASASAWSGCEGAVGNSAAVCATVLAGSTGAARARACDSSVSVS